MSSATAAAAAATQQRALVVSIRLMSYVLPADLQQAPHFVQLCQQIKSCDGILERMENLLSGFQADLRMTEPASR
jgi:hypothetical protein